MTQKRPAGGKGGMRSRNTTSRTRQGVASRELLEARRRKRQREVMRNRIIFGIACLAILALLVLAVIKIGGAAFSSGSASDSTITFSKDGQVTFEEVTAFDDQTYSKQELKSYTKNLISDFNDSYGDKAVSLKRITFRRGQVYIKTVYKDADSYKAFTSYDTYNGAYGGAVGAGYDFAQKFSAVTDGKKAAGETIDAESTFTGSKVAIVKENVTVSVPGVISYVSEASTEMVNDHTVQISQADGNEDAADLVYIIYSDK